MPLRIACDLDGTVADMETMLQREAERLFGPEVDVRARGHVVVERNGAKGRLAAAPSVGAAGAPNSVRAGAPGITAPASSVGESTAEPATTARALTDAQLRTLWTHVRRIENFWETLTELEAGTVARLFERSVAHRWEVVFVTQRPSTAGATAQRQSQRWLAAHGFEHPSVYVMTGSRGKLADALALDVVVDDRPENCLAVRADSRARALLVWRDAPDAVPAGTASVGIDVVFSMAEALQELEAMSRARTRPPRGLLTRLRDMMG